ncbi:Basic-region helix-loop-helix (bHLH) transcription factor [Penicillium ucsense]|uniref:Basic-region helix-loop-helix (BHLH) transcription factor n=1 Tax=Penicillium ucsense TaxID=2839758 RepID=A0A8J8W299_9EURO|nr:Basic-region helix-loop-helix (bHLH) transcription factor [Penicillium ucsense]KAF7734392.1 Basic-region helix-loop-helix (bHLH) transcription factor [Penicillium ucsense]
MDNDFELFSPRRQSGGDEYLGMESHPGDASQDWTQWMRWDEPTFTDNNLKDANSSSSGFFPSPQTTSSSPDQIKSINFSPNLPLGHMEMPLSAPTRPGQFHTKDTTSVPTQGQGGQVPLVCSDETNRKRKTSSDDLPVPTTGLVRSNQKMPAKKRAHNVIEKRYRANLNEKIAELRDSVPSLRALKNATGDSNDDEDEPDGNTPANKLNKASILSKATEYIKHLELRNKRLEDENTALKIRLRESDKAADQGVTSCGSISSPSNYTASSDPGTSPSVFSNPEEHHESTSTTSHPPEGLIQVPDAFKRLRDEGAKSGGIFSQSYMQSTTRSTSQSRDRGSRRKSRMPNKYMIGALAGLMVLDGLASDNSDTEQKGLLSLPLNLLSRLRLPYVEFYMKSLWASWHTRAVFHVLVLAGLVVGSAFVVFVYLFNAQPVTQRGPDKTVAGGQHAPFASSDFRRQAWLTSMQRVGVPRHRFFREWYVVTSRCFEYVLRCLMGWKLYSWATGITEEDEKGRVKTWDIAIDAQLTGGDVEISKSRLVLTIFAAGTLPRSPMRMMLKAIHIRILLWRVGQPGSWTSQVSNDAARALAKYQWAIARTINNALPVGHPDLLPSHLAALVNVDCEDIMIDSIIQRAANLTWNRPTQEGVIDDEVLLDVVEEDPAIQCSVDALAAWWSSHLLQNALLKYLEASEGASMSKRSRDIFKEKIRMALDVAPKLSAAYTRALVMKAVFFDNNRAENIGAVLATLPRESLKSGMSHAANFVDSSLPISVRDEISLAVRCAMILALVTPREPGDKPLPESFSVHKAIQWFNKLPVDPVDLSLLGFSAVYHLLHFLASDVDYIASSDSSATASSVSDPESSGNDRRVKPTSHKRKAAVQVADFPNLAHVAAQLIYWARNAYNPAFYGFSSSLVEVIVKSCTELCTRAGVNVEDYLQAISEPVPARKRRQRRRRRETRRIPETELSPNASGSLLGKPLRRERSASNDTGYGSLSPGEEAKPDTGTQ